MIRKNSSFISILRLLAMPALLAALLMGCSSGSSSSSSDSGSDSVSASSTSATASSVGVSAASLGSVTSRSLVFSTSDVAITTATGDQSEPDVAYDGSNSNRYLMVWTDSQTEETTGKDIYGAFYTAAGTPGAAFAISTATGDQLHPKVAYDSVNQVFLVVWSDSRNAYSQIYGQRVAASGTLSGANFAISTHDATYISQVQPAIVYNSVTSLFMVAWVDYTAADTTRQVTIGSCNGGADAIGDYIPFSAVDDRLVRYVDVSSGGVVGGTIGESDGSMPVKTAGWNAVYTCADLTSFSSVQIEEIVATASFNTMISESNPIISFNPSGGEVVVGWQGIKQEVGNPTTAGVTITATRTVTVDGGGIPDDPAWSSIVTAYDPSVTIPDENQKIHFRSNLGFGLITDISMDAGGLNSYNPAVTFDSVNDKYLVTWESDDSEAGNGENIYGQLIDITGFSAYSGTFGISTVQYDQTKPRLAFDPSQQRYLVVWEDARNTPTNVSNMDVYGQFIDSQGQLSGSNFIMTINTSNQQQPSVAFGDTESQYFLAAWKDGRNATTSGSGTGQSDIYANLWQYSTAPSLVITDSSGVEIFNQSYDFGSVTYGDSATFTFRLYNNGNAPLTISDIAGDSSVNISGSIDSDMPFNITTPVPSIIQPGTYYEMGVQFSPTSSSGTTYSGSLTITSDGAGLTPLYFSGALLSGTAIPLFINTTSSTITDGTVGIAYSATVVAEGGTTPYEYSVSTGELPIGLELDAATGGITGTPNTAGAYVFTLTVTDDQNATDSEDFTITIADSTGDGGDGGGDGGGDSGGGGGEACFIATAAYGSYLDPHVMALRSFRDNYLQTNPAGREFVRFYYRNAPPIANYIARHEGLRTATRVALTPLVYGVQYPLLGFGMIIAAGAMGAGAIARRRRNKKK